MDFEVFYRNQYERVLRTACLLAGNRGEAHDLTQEAFARALSSWGRVSRMDAPGAWLHTVLVNLARRRWRRAATERSALERSGLDTRGFAEAHDELRLVLRDALVDLPRRQREAVVLRYLADFSVDDAANVMSCSTGSVKKHCSRGLASLRAALESVDWANVTARTEEVPDVVS